MAVVSQGLLLHSRLFITPHYASLNLRQVGFYNLLLLGEHPIQILFKLIRPDVSFDNDPVRVDQQVIGNTINAIELANLACAASRAEYVSPGKLVVLYGF